MLPDFTFVSITYNHERFILQHLESIKYQVRNYGNKIKIDLLICDDASNDDTVLVAKHWVERNKAFFNDVRIIRNEKNAGTVSNVCNAYKMVRTDNFKLLAGDDLFFKNNIFEIAGKADIVISPTAYFNDAYISRVTRHEIPMYVYMYLDTLNHGNSKALSTNITYNNYIDAPGVFLNKKVISDGLIEYISKYRFIEDFPSWYYLLVEKCNDYSISITPKPYVLYRYESGISFSGKNKHSFFEDELYRLRKDLKLKLFRYPKWINPYTYYFKAKHTIQKKQASKIMHNDFGWMNDEGFAEEANGYLRMIYKKADEEYRESLGRS